MLVVVFGYCGLLLLEVFNDGFCVVLICVNVVDGLCLLFYFEEKICECL